MKIYGMKDAALALEIELNKSEMSPDTVAEVAERLRAGFSEIPTHSTSYPYLALARRRGIDYGAVLWYVDILGNGTDWDRQAIRATTELRPRDRIDILAEYDAEMARRADRRNAENARGLGVGTQPQF